MGRGWTSSSSSGPEEKDKRRALDSSSESHTPPPSPSACPPTQTLHSAEETEKTKHGPHNTRLHYKTVEPVELWKRTRSFFPGFLDLNVSTFCSTFGPQSLFAFDPPFYARLLPAVCIWHIVKKDCGVCALRGDMSPQAPQSQVRANILKFLKSFLGILRILQIVFGGGLWVTIAANKYEGSIHFVLFVAVLFWLLTLALFFVTLLDKQDLVPVVGGQRWLNTNLAHDAAAAALYLPAIGVMIYKTERNAYCNLDKYEHMCLYKVYLTAAVFACLACVAYLVSLVYGACRKCRGEQTVI